MGFTNFSYLEEFYTRTNSSTMPTNKEVDAFLDQKKHPQRALVEALRQLIMSCDKSLVENVKWNAPNYVYNNIDRITLNLSGKGMVRVILHCGAEKRRAPATPLIKETSGLLSWPSNDRAIAQFKSIDELTSNAVVFKKCIQLWLKAEY